MNARREPAERKPSHYLIQFRDEHGQPRERRTHRRDIALVIGEHRAPSAVVAVFFGPRDPETGHRVETQESLAVFP